MTTAIKPIFATFVELRDALQPLHLDDPQMVSDLHDIWKLGAPSLDSIIRNPRGYDERRQQTGNIEKRLILPTALIKWIKAASEKRGMPLSDAQAAELAQGRARHHW